VTNFSIADLRTSLVAFAMLLFSCIAASAGDASLSFQKSETGITVVASNSPPDATLSLHLVDPDSGETGPAMLCDAETQIPRQITLTPRFGLVANSVYRAVLKSGELTLAETDHATAAGATSVPRVVSIAPSSKKLPANLLKFYITFSEPMRGGRDIFNSFHIEDAAGKRVEAPWRQQELWSDDHRTLTLWIHPGRVKQGVNLRTSMGPVLLPHKQYSLIIDKGILSLPGSATAQPTHKRFTTIAEDHERPSAKEWHLRLPVIGTKDPVEVVSPEPLDAALAIRYLTINSEDEKVFPTTPLIKKSKDEHAGNGTVFTFVPVHPWRDEIYTLHAGEFLEDLAGNTPTRVFDTDLDAPAPEPGDDDLRRDFRPVSAEK